jgi:hypothetical protein
MNEQRIKTFADLADRYAYSISDSDPSVNWYTVRDQKFAVLIVEECINICISNRDDDSADHIEKHFGVEE